MGSNSFGTLFRITTWGESHGEAVGVVIDGCPAGLPLGEGEIHEALQRRSPGRNCHTSTRQESDAVQILSGVFDGQTTGAPISLLIPNRDVQSAPYESVKQMLRPGHAQYTYQKKYGVFDYRGGGRASARETACRVAAGAVAHKLLRAHGVTLGAYLKQLGSIEAQVGEDALERSEASALFCPDRVAEEGMIEVLAALREEGDSLGGIVEFVARDVPIGLGDPVYGKLQANLAKALMSLPAAKGFELGSGFRCACMKGSAHNDPFAMDAGNVVMRSNHAGGVLGGISTGMPLVGRVAFKPTSSIQKPQETLTQDGHRAILSMPAHTRHDPCVAIRAVPVVAAMVALVLADALLLNRVARL